MLLMPFHCFNAAASLPRYACFRYYAMIDAIIAAMLRLIRGDRCAARAEVVE